jgi:hypothetical protein
MIIKAFLLANVHANILHKYSMFFEIVETFPQVPFQNVDGRVADGINNTAVIARI